MPSVYSELSNEKRHKNNTLGQTILLYLVPNRIYIHDQQLNVSGPQEDL